MVGLREQVTYPQPGSDTYGLVEKMAFHYYLREVTALSDFPESSDSHWLRAENALIDWCKHQGESHTKWTSNTESALHELLNTYAHDRMNSVDFCETCAQTDHKFDDWIYAQDRLAQQIMHQVTLIP